MRNLIILAGIVGTFALLAWGFVFWTNLGPLAVFGILVLVLAILVYLYVMLIRVRESSLSFHICFVIALLICGCLTLLSVPATWLERAVQVVIDGTNRILYQTDYARLGAACREIMNNYRNYRPDPNPSGGQFDRNDPAVPEIVRNLHPAYISADNESVRIVIFCGHHTLHLVARVKDEEPDCPVTWKLGPGLWLYEPEHLVRVKYPPGYPKYPK